MLLPPKKLHLQPKENQPLLKTLYQLANASGGGPSNDNLLRTVMHSSSFLVFQTPMGKLAKPYERFIQLVKQSERTIKQTAMTAGCEFTITVNGARYEELKMRYAAQTR